MPLLVAHVPGFVDVPSHLARHHILSLRDADTPLLRYFTVSWRWIANLGVDIPAVILAPLLGADLATRVVVAAIAPLTILGMLALSRAAHGRISASAIVALPFAFHQAWMWGFINYCLSAALALLVAAWVMARPTRGLAEQLALALAALVVWTAHMAGWGILLVLAAGCELAKLRRPSNLFTAAGRNLPLLLPLVPLVAWRGNSRDPQAPLTYVDFLHTKATVFASVFRGTEKPLDLALLAAVILASILALVWAGRRRTEARLVVGGILLLVCTILAPTIIFNSWGTDLRLAPVALMVLILSIGPATNARREKLICCIGASLFLVRVGSIAHQWASRGPLLERKLTVLDAVPIGGKLGLIYVPQACGFGWRLEPDSKLASYAVVRRQAFVNTLFMVDNARLVDVRDPKLDRLFRVNSPIIARICPDNLPDFHAIGATIHNFRGLSFDAVWISGVDPATLPPMPGFTVRRVIDQEILLRRTSG